MYLKPLEQFICDTCGNIIENPEHGTVMWKYKTVNHQRVQYDFKIVHHFIHSPLVKDAGKNRCDPDEYPATTKLTDFLSSVEHSNSLIHILGFLDNGVAIQKEFKGVNVENIREYVEFIRRVTLPYYDEARQYWNDAILEGAFGGYNEYIIYTPEILQKIINTYKNR